MRIKEVIMEDGTIIDGKYVTNLEIEHKYFEQPIYIYIDRALCTFYPIKPIFDYRFFTTLNSGEQFALSQ